MLCLASVKLINSVLIISAGKERENEICYHPFRMTPYLIKVQDPEIAEDQLCCVLLAEKVHSGYEGNPLSAQRLAWFPESEN